jgi:hypothetical protein
MRTIRLLLSSCEEEAKGMLARTRYPGFGSSSDHPSRPARAGQWLCGLRHRYSRGAAEDSIHAGDTPPAIGLTLRFPEIREPNTIDTLLDSAHADCMHEGNWLRTIMYAFQHDAAVFMTAPVLLSPGKSMLEKMQETEQLTLMLITGAGITSALHDLANGANMAFRKSAFAQVNGYQGNEQYASGDDMFLIEKMRAAFPDKISFVKSTDATVYTSGKKDWASLLKQRLRWAGKNKGLGNKTINRIWVFVGAYQILLVVLLLTAIFHYTSSWPILIVFCAKWTADYMLIATAAAFFKRTSVLRYFVPLQFYYTYYILRLGLMMILGKKGDWELR